MVYKLLFVTLLVLSFTLPNISGQTGNNFFVEVAGPGVVSANFDTRFSGGEAGIGARVGVGGWSIDRYTEVFIPVALNYLIGRDGRNYFEIGAGYTQVISSGSGSALFDGSFGHLHFGYRLQPQEGGVTFRAGLTPIFRDDFFIPYYVSLSVGYKF